MSDEDLYDEEPDESSQDDDFLDFWDSLPQRKRETITIMGVKVEIPTGMPLALEMQFKGLLTSSDPDDVRYLVSELFGSGVCQEWEKAGMTSEQFQVVMAWGYRNGMGRPTTLEEAHRAVQEGEQEREEDDGGKAPMNRASRRASGSTGHSSRRTSNASTDSARRRSRR